MSLVTVGLVRPILIAQVVIDNLYGVIPLVLVADTQLTATTEMGDFN
jgi:hypothetical protein